MRLLLMGSIATAIAAKVWLAATLPITGDEALFYGWSQHLALGYYDHPPMIAWMLAGLVAISDSVFFLRLPTVLLSLFVALGIWDLIRRLNPEASQQATLVACLFVVLPINWFGVPVTNDTPLIALYFLSVYFFIRAEFLLGQEGSSRSKIRYLLFSASGLFLGLAFFSKYLAALGGLAFTAALLRPGSWGGRGLGHALLAIFIIGFAASPFIGLNLYYNYTNCWNNILFNLINRNEGSGFNSQGIFTYVLTLLYLFTPWVSWRLWKARQDLTAFKGLVLLAFTPFLIFLLLASFRTVGLHWLLAFLPFVFVVLGVTSTSSTQLLRYQRFTLYLGLPHLLFFIIALSPVIDMWSDKSFYRSVKFLEDAKTLPSLALATAPEGTVLMSTGYSPGSILGYHAKQHVPVFGEGSRYGRFDDAIVNFESYNQKPVTIISRSEPNVEAYRPYFEDLKVETVQINNRVYWLVHGTYFKFEVYKSNVLQAIANRFYQVPDVLPKGSCPFVDRYDLQLPNLKRS